MTLLSEADSHILISSLAFVGICIFIPTWAQCRQGRVHRASDFSLLSDSLISLDVDFHVAAPVTSLGCLHIPSISANCQLSAIRYLRTVSTSPVGLKQAQSIQ